MAAGGGCWGLLDCMMTPVNCIALCSDFLRKDENTDLIVAGHRTTLVRAAMAHNRCGQSGTLQSWA